MAQQQEAPVQCEDYAEPNSYVVVYDTETYNYKCHAQNILQMCENTVVVWGDESFPLSRTPTFIPAMTHNLADITEDADPTEDVDMESRRWITDWGVMDIDYTDGPEAVEDLKEEEAVKEE